MKESKKKLKKDEKAPEFNLKGTDGKQYSLEDFLHYKAILIVFTCNHCPYAKAKIDILNEIAEEYDQVAVIGINPNDSKEYPEDSFEKMKELVKEGKIKYDFYLRDKTQSVARKYGAICTPDPFLFKKENGEFRLVYHGRLDDALNPDDEPTRQYIKEIIEDILNNKKVERDFLPSRGCSIKWRELKEADKPFSEELKLSKERAEDLIQNLAEEVKEDNICISPPGEGWKVNIDHKEPIKVNINFKEENLDLRLKFEK